MQNVGHSTRWSNIQKTLATAHVSPWKLALPNSVLILHAGVTDTREDTSNTCSCYVLCDVKERMLNVVIKWFTEDVPLFLKSQIGQHMNCFSMFILSLYFPTYRTTFLFTAAALQYLSGTF